MCRGKDQGKLLAFSSTSSANADSIVVALLDPEGQPLDPDLYQVLDTLNPPTEAQRSTPLIIVDPGVEFLVAIQSGPLAAPQPMEVYALSNGASEYLLLEELPANGTILFGVGGDSATFQSTEASSPRIQQLYDGRTTSYDVNGHPLQLPEEVVASQDWDRAAKQVRYSSNAKRTLAWNVQVTGVRDSGQAGWVALGTRVPPGAEILVDYSRASATTAPLAWVIAKDGSRTPMRMQRVTESLIEEYRDELYTVQGPS